MRNVVPVRRGKIIDEEDISVIILAGNAGYRMKSYGNRSLIKVNEEKTVLDGQVEIVRKKFPRSDIIIVSGFESDRVIKNRPDRTRIVENQLYQDTNEVEQLRLAFNNIVTNNALIVSGNVIFDYNAIKDVLLDKSCIIVDTKNQLPENSIGVTIVDKQATIMAYGIKPLWSYIIYLVGKELKYLKQVCGDREKSKMYMFEVINIMLQKYQIDVVQPIQISLFKIDTPKHVGEIK